MLISEEQLDKFIALYKKHTGKTINKQKALDSAIKLVTLVETLYKYKYEKSNRKN